MSPTIPESSVKLKTKTKPINWHPCLPKINTGSLYFLPYSEARNSGVCSVINLMFLRLQFAGLSAFPFLFTYLLLQPWNIFLLTTASLFYFLVSLFLLVRIYCSVSPCPQLFWCVSLIEPNKKGFNSFPRLFSKSLILPFSSKDVERIKCGSTRLGG